MHWGVPKTNTKMADFCHSFPSDGGGGGEGRASKGMGEMLPMPLVCSH